MSVSYGSGSFSGTEYTDKVTYGGLTVNAQSIGAASSSSGFTGVDGIIGFGTLLTGQTPESRFKKPILNEDWLVSYFQSTC